jgi:hypothetical protein
MNPCGSCKNRCFGGTYRLNLLGRHIQQDSTIRCYRCVKFKSYILISSYCVTFPTVFIIVYFITSLIVGDGTRRYVRFEISMAVNPKNAVFWDIKNQFVPNRRHITSPLQSPTGWCYVKFEVLTAVIMKNAVFWDIETQFVPHTKHIMPLLQSPAG